MKQEERENRTRTSKKKKKSFEHSVELNWACSVPLCFSEVCACRQRETEGCVMVCYWAVVGTSQWGPETQAELQWHGRKNGRGTVKWIQAPPAHIGMLLTLLFYLRVKGTVVHHTQRQREKNRMKRSNGWRNKTEWLKRWEIIALFCFIKWISFLKGIVLRKKYSYTSCRFCVKHKRRCLECLSFSFFNNMIGDYYCKWPFTCILLKILQDCNGGE